MAPIIASLPHPEERPFGRVSKDEASWFETREDALLTKIRWHRAFVQCIVLTTSISSLDVIMDMDQIRTFVAVARGRSFSGAAATVHPSPPALIRPLQMLEPRFHIALFRHPPDRRIPTAARA